MVSEDQHIAESHNVAHDHERSATLTQGSTTEIVANENPQRDEPTEFDEGPNRGESVASVENPRTHESVVSITTAEPPLQNAPLHLPISPQQRAQINGWEKFGWLALIALIGGLVLIIGIMGFLTFLWFGSWKVKTWHNIAINNWFTRCTSLSALFLRTAVSAQAGIATAMLASVALEKMEVHIKSAASISAMRNSAAGPYFFTWSVLSSAWGRNNFRRKMMVPTLALFLTITTVLIQFTTTALLSDLKPQMIPGRNRNYTLATNFKYVNGKIPLVSRGTTWTAKPPFYPAFAEYHEAPPEGGEEGVSDTGLTLRAFLPFQDQLTRGNLRTYSGKATVLDSRVACMRPNFTNQRIHLADDGLSTLALTGQVNAALNASHLVLKYANQIYANQSITAWDDRSLANFTCILPFNSAQDAGLWRLSICQPNYPTGKLANEFNISHGEEAGETTWNNPYGVNFASMYLVVLISGGNASDWADGIAGETSEYDIIVGPGTAPSFFSNHGEWQDLLFASNFSLRLSTTLCFTAFETADLSISATGSENRTEPIPFYNSSTQTYDYTSIRRQLGQPDNSKPLFSEQVSDRGILQLQKRSSWLPGAGDYDYAGGLSYPLDFANMFGPSTSQTVDWPDHGGGGTPCTCFMSFGQRDVWGKIYSIRADPSLFSLIQEILQKGAPMAFAIQSIVTTLAGIAYYDQMQQFNGLGTVAQSDFSLMAVPQSYKGFTAVVVVVFAHLILLSIIFWLFLAQTKVSSLGNSWQTIAQLQGDELGQLIAISSLKTDSEVEEIIEGSELRRRFVSIKVTKDQKKARVVLGSSSVKNTVLPYPGT